MKRPSVGIIMGSESDLSVMAEAGTALEEFGVRPRRGHTALLKHHDAIGFHDR